MERLQFFIRETPPARLDKALARDVPADSGLSRSRLAKLLADGAVEVDNAVVQDPRARVAEGAHVVVTLAPAPAPDHLVAEAIPLDVVYEDSDLIVINKPAGMVVHPAPGTPSGTVVNALMHHCGADLSGVGGLRRPGIVHRIDKDTSGLLVAAKTDVAHTGLATQFADHSIERRYLALCYGVPDTGDPRLKGVRGVSFEAGNILRIQTFLGRHRTDRQRQAVSFDQGRHAVTRARVLSVFGTPATLALLECWLETGRTHQIRVHLAHAGHGLVGDPVYGGRRKLSEKALSGAAVQAVAQFSRQALHAATLGFVHPVSGKTLQFQADLPPDFETLVASLRSSE